MSSKRERPEGGEEEEEEAKQQCLKDEPIPMFVTVEKYAEENPEKVTLLHVMSQEDNKRELDSEHIYMRAQNLAMFFQLMKNFSTEHKHSSNLFFHHILTDKRLYENLHAIRNSSMEKMRSDFELDYDTCCEYNIGYVYLKKFLSTLPEDHWFLENPIIKIDSMGEGLCFRNENNEQLAFDGFMTYIFFDKAN